MTPAYGDPFDRGRRGREPMRNQSLSRLKEPPHRKHKNARRIRGPTPNLPPPVPQNARHIRETVPIFGDERHEKPQRHLRLILANTNLLPVNGKGIKQLHYNQRMREEGMCISTTTLESIGGMFRRIIAGWNAFGSYRSTKAEWPTTSAKLEKPAQTNNCQEDAGLRYYKRLCQERGNLRLTRREDGYQWCCMEEANRRCA